MLKLLRKILILFELKNLIYLLLTSCSEGNMLGDDDMMSVKSCSSRGPALPLVDLQPPFQPTSSPVHLQRRFMVKDSSCSYLTITYYKLMF